MGNDIKIPNSHRREVEEQRNKSQHEMKQHLIAEIESISLLITTTIQQVKQVEHILNQHVRNIEYYKEIIMDLSIKLDQIKLEQINVNLAHDYHVEKAKDNLQKLEEPLLTSDDEDSVEEYSESIIKEMEDKALLLNTEIAQKEEIITKMYKKLNL